MPSVAANGITIEHEVAGDPADPPLLLVHGLGAQLIAWDRELIDALVAEGFFVVCFDNRDVGRSTWFDEAGTVDLVALVEGRAAAPYLLADMAADTAGLLDALGIGSAHVLGVSMGGMIAQSLAVARPERIRSLVSIMSTTGDPAVGAPHPEALDAILRPAPEDRAAAADQAVEVWRILGSPGFAFDEDRVRASATAAYDRAFHPDGPNRQTAAIVASPDRTPALRGLDCPTLVVHGEADRLVDPSGGKATAAAIPGAQLWLVPGMGHHLPVELVGELADRVAAHAHPHDRRVSGAR